MSGQICGYLLTAGWFLAILGNIVAAITSGIDKYGGVIGIALAAVGLAGTLAALAILNAGQGLSWPFLCVVGLPVSGLGSAIVFVTVGKPGSAASQAGTILAFGGIAAIFVGLILSSVL